MTAVEGRQRVLGGILVASAALTILVLHEVVATVFFAVTVAYVLSPVRRWIRRRGIGPRGATVLVTVGSVLGAIGAIAPLGVVLFYRIEDAYLLLESLPEVLAIQVAGQTVEIVLEDVIVLAEGWLRTTAVQASSALPVLALKFAVFAFVVFALVHNERDIGESLTSVIPPRHRDIAEALHTRARDTLVAIYVLQGATAVATLVVALPVFYAFGYESWLALATIAGILQFVPVIGPSLLVVVLTIAELLMGDLVRGLLILVVGGVVIAAVPDILIRPTLATHTTELSSVLYFVGFIGGMLSLGAIGVILGPLLVALFVEVWRLVAEGFDTEAQPVGT